MLSHLARRMTANLRVLLACLMIALAPFVAGVLPTATAHDCTAADPKTSCGECNDLLPHNHRYNNGKNYCRSNPLPGKQECEDVQNGQTHLYGAPALGFVIFIGSDWSIPPCNFGDTTWDGHYEYAFGGAWLQAATSACTAAFADHAPGATITVYDNQLTGTLQSDVAFSVYADTLNNDPIPSEPNCGDFESDYGVDCVNSCAPAFPPGLDGSYQVYVSGTSGSIST